jgi:hypothetical protein
MYLTYETRKVTHTKCRCTKLLSNDMKRRCLHFQIVIFLVNIACNIIIKILFQQGTRFSFFIRNVIF